MASDTAEYSDSRLSPGGPDADEKELIRSPSRPMPSRLPAYVDWVLENRGDVAPFEWRLAALTAAGFFYAGVLLASHAFLASPTQRRVLCDDTARGVCELILLEDPDCSVPRSGYEFVHPDRSIVGAFGLVCEDAPVAAQLSELLYWGWGLSSPLWGVLADGPRGRRGAYGWAILLCLACTLIFVLLPVNGFGLFLYGLARFGLGMACGGVTTVGYALVSECCSGAGRIRAAAFAVAGLKVGAAALAAVAPLISGWRSLSVLLMFAGMPLYIAHSWHVESPRWLAGTGNPEATYQVLCHAVSYQGATDLPPPRRRPAGEAASSATPAAAWGCVVLQTLRRLWCCLVVLGLAWCAMPLCRHALSAAGGDTVGSGALPPMVSGTLLELPLVPLGAWLSGRSCGIRCGRRPLLSCGLLGAGVLCFVAQPGGGAVPLSMTLAAYVARMVVAACSALLYSYTCELVPLAARCTVLGVCAALASFAQLFALSFVDGREPDAGEGAALGLAPQTLVAGLCVACGLLAVLLPETVGKPMPADLNDPETKRRCLGLRSCRRAPAAEQAEAESPPPQLLGVPAANGD